MVFYEKSGGLLKSILNQRHLVYQADSFSSVNHKNNYSLL